MARGPVSIARQVAAHQERAMPEILRRLGDGDGLATICRDEGMPDRATVRRWCMADAGLAEQVEQARQDGLVYRAEKAVKAAMEATDPQLGRLAFDAERWYLGKLSNAFAERPKIETQINTQVNVDAGNPFGRIAEFLDRAAAAIAGGACSTQLVVGDGAAGSGSTAGRLDDVAPAGGTRLG